MGYIHGPKKSESFQFSVRLLNVSDGEYAINPTIVAGDWKRSIGGGTLAALATTPVVSPAGSSQIVVTLGVSETPGPFTTVQCIDLTNPKAFHDNAWEVHQTDAGSGSGAVITVNPSAFIDSEAIANLVGPYIANLLINSLNLPTAGEWAQILAQSALITAIKAKTDVLTFTGSLLQVILAGIDATRQTLIKDLVFASGNDVTHTIPQLPVGALPVTPTLHQLEAALYALLRNGTQTTGTGTSGTRNLRQADGTIIAVATIAKNPGSVDTGKLDA